MNFHVMTLFPEMIEQAFNASITGRAVQEGRITLHVVNIRDYTQDKHNKVDDYPYGGGAGMLMQAQPVYDTFRAVEGQVRERRRKTGACADGKEGPALRVIYATPQGTPFTQELAEELSAEEDIVILCGHYEGIDERVLEEIVTDYISIGDYILTGGELPAMVIMDAVARLVPEVLHNEDSAEVESFHNSLLEYPQYSRPETWKGRRAPQVLLSGDHKKIAAWRLEQSVKRTKERRPDLYDRYLHQEETLKLLKRSKLLHMGLMEPMRAGSARLLYARGCNVLIREKKSGLYLMTAEEEAAAKEMLRILGQDMAGRREPSKLLMACQDWLPPLVGEETGFVPGVELRQAVYTRGVPFPPARDLIIRQLDGADYPAVIRAAAAAYPEAEDQAYLKGRISAGAVYGSFTQEGLTGFIGLHEEGSMGMLFVGERYRRRGIASALEKDCINRLLRAGRIPYCQIRKENEVSLRLQEKLGLRISKSGLWLCRKSAGDKFRG